ncbi:2OG-Fe(II) oxygenase [Paraburkholderia phosphatilytica]|uniref:2OG-Fe(II) oxygenase n=1 Tax=Paraburkholderia phosphatilytica TaxID=2282883 RepID=UPI000E4DDC88|nr:2OG-Fe(II) oxygenase [Paraburkholderia phosphatilytica]
METLDAAWQDWLTLNVQRGCTAESMLDAMLRAGLDPLTARAAVAARMATAAPAASVAPEAEAAALEPVDMDDSPVVTAAVAARATARAAVASGADAYRYDPAPVEAGNVIHALDRDVEVLMRCERPQLIVFGNVLSADECTQLIDRSRHSLRRSTTINADDGSEDVIQNRTSEGIWYPRCADDFIARLDRRIAALMNSPLENGEGLQVLHYRTGGEYRPHFDYFPPEQAGSARHTAHGGQRVATLIVYLNDVEHGGATIFPEAGISVSAKQGNAVYFRYLNGSGQLDPLSLHGGAPVSGGEKWIMTKWIREHAYV